MRNLKALFPLGLGVLVHACATVGGLESGSPLHQAMIGIPWTSYEWVVPVCELLQRVLCAYLFFLVLAVLRDTRPLRRVLAAGAFTWLWLLVSCGAMALNALPAVRAPLSLLAPAVLLALTVWLAVTYARECA